MVSFTTPAFIVRSTDVGAADRLYTLYTRDRGKIDVIAKGIRKAESKLQSSMQVAAELEVYVIAQRRFTLGGSVIREVLPEIFSSLPALWAFQHALDIVHTLTQHEHPDKAVFELLKSFLRTLNLHHRAQPERILYSTVSFDVHLLGVLGHAPALGIADEDDDRYALRSGGLYFRKDMAGLPYQLITKEGRSLLRFAQHKSFEDCFMVVIRPAQADMQRLYMRVLLEEYDAASLSSDRTIKDFLPSK
ncbi:MAG: DNA repair protein RecO [Patescibacteria group bacterium]|jgi:DNA repair protein RecO